MPRSTNLSTAIPQEGLTAAEFFAAVHGLLDAHALMTIIGLPDELKCLQRNINVSVEAAARLARNLANGVFGGLESSSFKQKTRDAESLFEAARNLEQRLFHARAAAGLAPRVGADNAHGSCATVALARILYEVTGVILQIANIAALKEYDRRINEAEKDSERPSAEEALAWNVTAQEVREHFANRFAFPDPVQLFGEMRIELIQLNAAATREQVDPCLPQEQLEEALHVWASASGSEKAAQILAVAHDRLKTVGQRQQEIYILDNQALGYTGQRWGALLGVTERAATKTDWWKKDRRRLTGN
jgi:hypothetical protein